MTFNEGRKISLSAGSVFSLVDSPKKRAGRRAVQKYFALTWQTIKFSNTFRYFVWIRQKLRNCSSLYGRDRLFYIVRSNTHERVLQKNRTLHGFVLYCKRRLVLRLFVRLLENILSGNKLFCSLIRFVFVHCCCSQALPINGKIGWLTCLWLFKVPMTWIFFFAFSGWWRYLRLEIIDLCAWRVLLVHFFVHWKYDWRPKSVPIKRAAKTIILHSCDVKRHVGN